MKSILAVAIAATALMACKADQSTSPRTSLSPNATVLHAMINNGRDFLTFQTVSPCNGEAINASGPLHAATRATDDGDGGLHIGGHENGHFDGVGETTGNVYVAELNSDFHLNARPPFPQNLTTTFEINFIAKGKAPNFGGHFNTHMTVNANGDVTVDGGEIEDVAVCQGDHSKGSPQP